MQRHAIRYTIKIYNFFPLSHRLANRTFEISTCLRPTDTVLRYTCYIRCAAPSGRSTSGLRAPSVGRSSTAGPIVPTEPGAGRTGGGPPAGPGNEFARPAEPPLRKLSGLARPTGGGIPRPGTAAASRLPAPGHRCAIFFILSGRVSKKFRIRPAVCFGSGFGSGSESWI